MTFYNRMQLVAYQVPTDKFYRKNEQSPEVRLPAGPACAIKSKLLDGMLDSMKAQLSADAFSRVMRMIAVAERASESLAIDPVPNTLKLFMAPEFYFRPEQEGGESWSYKPEEQALIMKALALVFSDPKYASWLFVFGTITSHETIGDFVKRVPNFPDPSRLPKMALKALLVWNTAIIVEGGVNKPIALKKLHYSGADDISRKFWPEFTNDNYTNLDVRLKNEYRVTAQDYLVMSKKNGQAESIIPVGDNLTLGVEICMDHAIGVVAQAFEEQQKYGRLDAQLVTSCGMRVAERSLVIGEKQFVFKMDGASTTAADWNPPWNASEIQTVIGWTNDQTPIASSINNLEQESDRKKAAWKQLNAIDEAIELKAPLKLDTGTLQACHYSSSGPDQQVAQMVPVDEACPQKLLVYHPVNLGSAVAQLVTDANAVSGN